MADPFTGVKKDSEDAKDAEKISTEKDETKSDSKKEADQATGATSSIFEASDDPLHPEFQPLKEISQSKHFGQALKNWIEREDLRIVARLVQLGELPGELCKPLAQLTETKVSAGLVDPCIIILLATKKVTKKLKDSEKTFDQVIHKIVDGEKKEYGFKFLDTQPTQRRAFCDYAVSMDHHRFAVQFVFRYGLTTHYPKLPQQVCLFTAHGILKRGLVGVATSLANGFPDVQWKCILEMFQPDSQSYAPDFALDLIKAWNMDIDEVETKFDCQSRKN